MYIGEEIPRGERRRYYSGGYMSKKRRELVRRVGYDAKNAAHLIRLLRMGIEFPTEGALHVERADSIELLDIKRGDWPLDKVKAEPNVSSNSPRKPTSAPPCLPNPTAAAPSACVDMISEYHKLSIG